eukprot:TRINITY_DN12081_c0_g1_i2.p1 TRINITY_DN12081_c0_g1~~TRINITY_DN12081_c0_g1_i2.p1  ORF type:complete len:729 (+),score=109.50 TRINITY_DN12081_c0_g1_i2:106-2187(+)
MAMVRVHPSPTIIPGSNEVVAIRTFNEDMDGYPRGKVAPERETRAASKEPKVIKVEWRRDGAIAALLALACLGALITVYSWDPRLAPHNIHHVKMNKFQAHLTSPLYAVRDTEPLVIPMDDDLPRTVVDLKIAVPCAGYCRGSGGHRRLQSGAKDARALAALPPVPQVGSKIMWKIVAQPVNRSNLVNPDMEDRVLESGELTLNDQDESEAYETVFLEDVDIVKSETLVVKFTTDSSVPLGFMCQVVQLGMLGKHRILLSGLLFLFAFGLILSEKINRCYATFIGAMMALFLVTITYGVPSIPNVMGMVDFGTLMLLCTMMMIVQILAVTGFFQWSAVRLAIIANGDAKVLFFVMANAMGVMSCILPNVTCVMLIGPITISLCKEMGLDPVPFYLAQTICSTVGGTTTKIGDPPNLVIGNKLGLSFIDFVKFNGPLIAMQLPLTSFLLYLRFKDKVSGKIHIDIDTMRRQHPILDQRKFLYAATIFFFVAVGLFTSSWHVVRPCWICCLGFFFIGLVIQHHDIKPWLSAVEWDTLLFFANLFIFVECLAELGLIKAIGSLLADTIKGVPIGARLEVAVILVLWVSTLGSAFLESLPYTTTMTYILADLRNNGTLGIPVEPLCWSLSVGACVGGIGSIMGSSANLVCLSVSERYSPGNPVTGRDFLVYGFPTLLMITVLATGYQLLLFCVIRPY